MLVFSFLWNFCLTSKMADVNTLQAANDKEIIFSFRFMSLFYVSNFKCPYPTVL